MSARAVRVLVVAPSPELVGGQSAQAARLLADLANEPSVHASFLRTDTALSGPLRRFASIRYARTVVRFPLYVGSLIAGIPRSDVVHVFAASFWSFVLAPTPAILLGRLLRRKVIVHYHSGEASEHLRAWPSARLTLRLADAIVVQSTYLQNVLGGFGLSSVAIPNHLELEAFPFRDRRPLRPLFLSARALEPNYDVFTLLRAFALVQQRVPSAELRVVGDGGERAELEALARDLGLRGVTFSGALAAERMAEAYESADVLLNASTVDSMPLSLLEAAACGLAVVSTDAGGISCVVEHGVTGLLVPVRDPDALAAAALRLLEEPELAAGLATNAREASSRYSWSATRPHWLALYGALVAPRTRRTLRGRSVDELRVRGTQMLAAASERIGVGRDGGAVFADGGLTLEQFRARSAPRLTAAFDDPTRTAAELQRRFGDTSAELLDRADRICEGRFDLLGHRDLSFGSPIDWQLDPLSGRRTPLVHWSRLTRPEPGSSGDRKVVWELNRHQSFVMLGRAYRLTGDERYAEAFVHQLRSWITDNPPGFGINWSSSLEIALRAISWTWALHLFRASPALTPELFQRVLELLQLHARHVQRQLSTYSSPNTHLTGEALGLYTLGTLWPELRGAREWRAAGREILIAELRRQVAKDGVYFERATAYQRYTIDFFTHFELLAAANDDAVPPIVRERLGAMLGFALSISRPDGTMPLLGDDDGGCLVPLSESSYEDPRPALAVGAVLLDRADFKAVAGGAAEELLWLLGPAGLAAYDRMEPLAPPETSKAFSRGGFYVLRDGWSGSASVLTISCGDHGGGHGHADALSFDLCVEGRPVLVDPGTFTYVRGLALDDAFRATAAHNTVVVDDVSSSVPAGPFVWSQVASCALRSWITNDACDFFEGSHDGYERLADPVTHVRSVLFLKGGYWVVRDRLVAAGEHRYELRFHFAPDARPTLRSSGVREPGLTIEAPGSEGAWALSTEWVSRRYGERVPAQVAGLRTTATGPQDFFTFLLPSAAGDARPVPARGGQAFEVDGDTVLVRNADSDVVAANGISSDFEWTVARGSGELVAVNGRSVSLDGVDVVRAPSCTGCAVARELDGRWVVQESPCAA